MHRNLGGFFSMEKKFGNLIKSLNLWEKKIQKTYKITTKFSNKKKK
jgi:hypothetical protein